MGSNLYNKEGKEVLKRDITYETFDDPPETITETFYFNLSQRELLELQVEQQGGLDEMVKRMIKSKDEGGILREFKKIILTSYGERSDDGKRFMKTDEIRENFAFSGAFDALFEELTTNTDKLEKFLLAVVPKEATIEMEKLKGAIDIPLPPLPPVA